VTGDDSSKLVASGITFDDISLLPARSAVVPTKADVRSKLTRRITLEIPIVSAAMDTVTESVLAIALAQEGGIGIIHKNLSVAAQTREVDKVKRSENGIITDPVTLHPNDSIQRARQVMDEHNVSGIPIVLDGNKLVGILTRRDMKFLDCPDTRAIDHVMTKDNLITAGPDTTLDEAQTILNKHKVEKLLLTEKDNRLVGLITMRDIDKLHQFPNSCKDQRGRFRVGAAVGVHDYERIESLINAGVDVVVVDTAHGHSENVIDTIKEIRKRYDIQLIAGNIATGQAATDLIDAGADALKVGIGPGSICTTRVISGVGVPQVTAIMNVAAVADPAGVPIIADGGIRYSGDITKAIAAGAHSAMLGSLFAGLDEAPGQLIIYKGRRYKEYRGMGTMGAMMAGSADRYGQTPTGKLVPEGVEGRVPYRGELADFVYQLIGGLRAGMGYCGTNDIEALRTNAKFVSISPAAQIENHPHDITITKESPNYSVEYVTEG